MIKARLMVAAVLAALALSGCSENERREIRQHEERLAASASQQQERIAAEAARQLRLARDYAAELAEETKRKAHALHEETMRLRNALNAETQRRFNKNLSELGEVLAILATIAGVFGFAIYSLRRLGERQAREWTKRHKSSLAAIEGAAGLRPEDRRELYRAAIVDAEVILPRTAV